MEHLWNKQQEETGVLREKHATVMNASRREGSQVYDPSDKKIKFKKEENTLQRIYPLLGNDLVNIFPRHPT
jgi:hypothetical protein